MQDHRVLASGGRGQRVIEDPLRLDDARARRGLAGAGVPQRPRGDIEQGIGGQRLHVEVVGIRLGQLHHGIGIGGVAGQQRVDVIWVVGREAGPQASLNPRSTTDAWPSVARLSSIRARASDAAMSTGSNASHALL